jgi:Kef-type K+ transport system membrane component KefB
VNLIASHWKRFSCVAILIGFSLAGVYQVCGQHWLLGCGKVMFDLSIISTILGTRNLTAKILLTFKSRSLLRSRTAQKSISLAAVAGIIVPIVLDIVEEFSRTEQARLTLAISSNLSLAAVSAFAIFPMLAAWFLLKNALAPSDLSRPPRLAKFLLLLIPRRNRESLLGDLEEEYVTIAFPEYGARLARLWYWWQVVASVMPLLWAQLKRVLGLAWLLKHIR